MSFSWDTAAVAVIVGVAAVWAVRAAWKAGRRKQVCSTCGSAGSCPLIKGAEAPCGVLTSLEPRTDDASGSADREHEEISRR